MASIIQMRSLTRNGGYLAQWDLACWYYQIPIEKHVQRYFGVKINGKDYVFTCLPMGFVASVFAAQHLTKALAQEIPKREVYIDNIFTASDTIEEAENFSAALAARCSRFNATLKESATEINTSMEILGVQCDAKQGTVALGKQFVENHRALLSKLFLGNVLGLRVREVMRAIGVLLRGIYILNLGFHNYFGILKVASVISQWPLHDRVQWTIDEHSATMATLMIRNEPVTVREKEIENHQSFPTIATDASRIGYGYIWSHKGKMVYGGGSWKSEQEDNMPKLEAAAISIALGSLAKFGYKVSRSTLLTDSLTFVNAYKKGHSLCEQINSTIGIVTQYHINTRHIRSENNPADNLSRGKPITRQDIGQMENLC